MEGAGRFGWGCGVAANVSDQGRLHFQSLRGGQA